LGPTSEFELGTKATRYELRTRSACTLPFCDWQTDRQNRHRCLIASFCLRPAARLAVIQRAHRKTQCIGSSLSGLWCLSAFGARGIAATAASLQGLNPSAGMPSQISPHTTAPALSGIHPPWGIPPPSLGLGGRAELACAFRTTPHTVRSEAFALP